MAKTTASNRSGKTRDVVAYVTTAVNSADIRREKRDGKDVIIVPSATMPDNIVMNGIMYPGDEIEASYASLEDTIAPFDHPTGPNGEFVPASSPRGLSLGYIGAHNENVTRRNGKVYLDKVIYVEQAAATANGRRVLEAIDKGEPVHTSTGLYYFGEKVENSEYSLVARDIVFDHDAILLDVSGAATPEQGVGMMVNSDGDKSKVKVVNSYLDHADDMLDYALSDVVRAMERKKSAGVVALLKEKILEMFSTDHPDLQITENKDSDMSEVKKEDLEALRNHMNDVQTQMAEKVSNAIADALKPITDFIAAEKQARELAANAEKATLVTKVVSQNRLSKEVAESLNIEALRAIAESPMSGGMGLNSAPASPSGGNKSFALPKGD